ncbi:MAG: biotin--[acetyl-CoA-carboxylase] ligase [Oscillatoriales cyanobacterium C42_A2020_001]|nr:biotin--[acetyl-CoA-carboxylase] ligase [Leptolyngbyaceae cyanobacterium C42_A2020_001]
MTTINQERLLAAYAIVQACRSFQARPLNELSLFDAVASTNQMAWESIDQGTRKPVVMARSQTAGRGQWGRQWQSEPGGLYLSAGLELELPVEHAAQLTLSVAWGIATALREIPPRLSGVTEGIPVQLKWLNDLVLHGRKLGGILTETRIQQGQITRAVVGVGINWDNPVPETGITLRSFLEQHDTPLIESLELLAAITLHGLLSGIHYHQQHGIEPILEAYFALLAHRDRPVDVNGQAGAIVGVAPTGELRVQLKSPQSPLGEWREPTTATEILVKPGTISLGYPL